MIASHALSYRLSQDKSLFYALLQILGASLFIALMTQIKLFLPFTPVPLTGQTLAVLAVGTFLGSRKGFLSVLLYLNEGFIGLPVFSGGGFGLAHLFGPTGGYMVGFVFQAYLAGWFIENTRRQVFGPLLLCSALQMGLGLLWLSHFVGWNQVLMLGLVPFIPGELLKILLLTRLCTIFRRRFERGANFSVMNFAGRGIFTPSEKFI